MVIPRGRICSQLEYQYFLDRKRVYRKLIDVSFEKHKITRTGLACAVPNAAFSCQCCYNKINLCDHQKSFKKKYFKYLLSASIISAFFLIRNKIWPLLKLFGYNQQLQRNKVPSRYKLVYSFNCKTGFKLLAFIHFISLSNF